MSGLHPPTSMHEQQGADAPVQKQDMYTPRVSSAKTNDRVDTYGQVGELGKVEDIACCSVQEENVLVL